MRITEEQLVEAYGKGDPKQRFTLIYKNYEVFLKLIDSFETGLFNRILYEREYNRREKNGGDLGVRIQTSSLSNPTAKKAMEELKIREAIRECDLSGDILEDTDEPEKHERDIRMIKMMRREYKVFNESLKSLSEKEYRITYKYIHKEQKLEKIAEEEELAYQSIKNLIAETRKMLAEKIIPFLGKEL